MAEDQVRFTHHYDQDADVLYISLGIDEPAYTENIDDMLMIDIGWFSGLPRGFRILGPKYHKLKALNLNMIVQQVGSQFKTLMEQQASAIRRQEPVIEEQLGAELNRAFSAVH